MTLIELLAVLAIVGLLATLAQPGYRHIAQRGQRAQARAALLEAAAFMERFHAVHHRYDRRLGEGDAAAPEVLPPSLRQVPAQGVPHHRLVLAHADAGTYRLEARPEPPGSDCGILTLDQAGRVGATGARGGADCWR